MDTLQTATKVIAQTTQQVDSINWWMIIAIVEFVIVIFLLLSKVKRNDDKRRAKEQVMAEGDIDIGPIIASFFGAESLYKELVRQCHPDKFVGDEEKQAIAKDLAARLGENKHELKKLNELKKEAIEKLNINI